MSPLLAALWLAVAGPSEGQAPPPPLPTVEPAPRAPDDEELIQNLELLERLDLLRHLELFDDGVDEGEARKGAQPGPAPPR